MLSLSDTKTDEKITKISFSEKGCNFGTNSSFEFKIWHINFKVDWQAVLKFQAYIFWNVRETICQIAIAPGRARKSLLITDIDNAVKNKHFLFLYRITKKIIASEIPFIF